MKLAIIAALVAIFLVGCQDATSATDSKPSAPVLPLTRTAQKLADGTCGARLVHDSLVGNYVSYGSRCPVPEALRTPHKDGSLPDSQHGAGVAYQIWETNDGNCEPRAWAISNVVTVAWCPKHPENFRWMFDTAYKMPNQITYGMPTN